jgi:hypothetical protein
LKKSSIGMAKITRREAARDESGNGVEGLQRKRRKRLTGQGN